MNASQKTTIIARGIARFAAVQDLAPSDARPEAKAIRNHWFVWCDAHPQWVEFVEREQFYLFDRVNAKL
jgi:hypothetical protein